MRDDVQVLISRERIAERVKELGKQITAEYAGKPLTVAGVLSGGAIFCADLVREIDLPLELAFVRASSYGAGTASSGKVITDFSGAHFAGRHVLIAEDIIDTGRTMAEITRKMLEGGALSVKLCCILDKPCRRVNDVVPDYVGFTVPDGFVVGYGLDYAGKYRNLPFIGRLPQ